MPMGLGFADALTGKTDGTARNQTPIQDAIKMISLRMPSFVGAQGIAPGQLLQGGGSGSFPFGGQTPGGLDELLRRLFMGGGMSGGGMAPMGGLPQPNIVPGGEQRGPMVSQPQPPPAMAPAPEIQKGPDAIQKIGTGVPTVPFGSRSPYTRMV